MSWAGIINRAFTADNVGAYLRSLPRPTFVRFVVVHNTGAPSLKTYRGYAARANPITDAQWLRNLEGFYRDEQKWKAGPHWFVTPNKVGLLAFTPSTVPGTHSPSWNSQSLGVEMVGDYQVEPFDPGVHDNVVALLAEMHLWLRLDPGTIRFHKEDTATTHKDCPGKNVNKAKLIADVRAKMAELQNVAPTKFTDVPPDLPDDVDAEPSVVAPVADKPSFLKRAAQWFSGGASLGFLGYLTSWEVVAVLCGFVLVMLVLIVWFFGPDKVRAWVGKQVN